MIWQLASDATGANSLLTAINQVVLARGTPPPPSSGVATFYRDCNYGNMATGLALGDYTLASSKLARFPSQGTGFKQIKLLPAISR